MYGVYKQGIYNRRGELVFYELFLEETTSGKYPEGVDPLKATSIVIDVITELGPRNVGGGKLLFINVPAIFLEASMFDLLPPEYIGIELVENKRLSSTFYENIKVLLRRGFKFCIDDFGFEKIDYLPLLNKCHYVKIDIKNSPYDEEELTEVIGILKDLKKGIIAKNIETKEDYEFAIELGFDFFQGFYLAKPIRVKDARTVAFIKTTILKLYEALKKGDIKNVVEVLEKDVGATYKLLKFASSAYFPKPKRISTVDEAVAYLGLDNLVKFTIILALSEVFADDDDIEIWKKALFKAILMEKLASIYAPHIKEKAYLAGLFSTASEALNQSPEEVARELSLDEDIIQAYEGKPNEIGFLLSISNLLEDVNKNESLLGKVARLLNISKEHIEDIIQQAKKESEKLLSYTS
ncbi:EAL and HDOD domain-containing protein [Thermocrinis minervae]|uniref:EAL and modified HD-GYP domain-containing signal transduction protein n=1 Tax=Thermocrinis minervae TaxID=381751 RepID=A0A1M6S8V9_9AQUI|nr:HDOD domain-containing protein [Thermocrinis minervae]SHK41129.1 EAL and modified HD-GYP domain-containing signal transduction protein [Thermocrinis minervae]